MIPTSDFPERRPERRVLDADVHPPNVLPEYNGMAYEGMATHRSRREVGECIGIGRIEHEQRMHGASVLTEKNSLLWNLLHLCFDRVLAAVQPWVGCDSWLFCGLIASAASVDGVDDNRGGMGGCVVVGFSFVKIGRFAYSSHSVPDGFRDGCADCAPSFGAALAVGCAMPCGTNTAPPRGE